MKKRRLPIGKTFLSLVEHLRDYENLKPQSFHLGHEQTTRVRNLELVIFDAIKKNLEDIHLGYLLNEVYYIRLYSEQ